MMRTFLLAIALATVLGRALGAQTRETTGHDTTARDTAFDERALPREVAREVTELYNRAGTLRVSGSMEIAADREVAGDLAVIGGPLTVAGHITGRVVVINSDVVLKPRSRIDGDLLVVGGRVEGRTDGYVGGEIRIYRQALYYHQDGSRIVVERRRGDDDGFLDRWRAQHSRSWSELKLASAHTYNRVEGLPIYFGPTFRTRTEHGRVSADLFGIFRTADDFKWNKDNLGHNARIEARTGDRLGLAVGGRLYDVVDAVEGWQLTDTEVGLASFFLHRDYRDYFNRHGGQLYGKLAATRDADFTVSLSDERWNSRADRDPYTLFRNEQPWRENPGMDEGRFHVAAATLRFDTRTDRADRADPWSGWYMTADYERGTGRVDQFGERSLLPGDVAPGSGAANPQITYGRGFLDLRRYNRLAPDAQLNFRAVLGGYTDGDRLPLERRLSVGGPGTLPGFDFRRVIGTEDRGTCSSGVAPAGVPAECDRIALAQVEYRGDLHVDIDPFDGDDDDGERDYHRFRLRSDAVWVVFADAGRGWLVGPREGDLRYPKGELPKLGTFRTDGGLGLDLGGIGLYVAKALSERDQPANFFVRVRRRF